MNEPLLSPEKVEAGYARFLAANPDAAARVNAVTQGLADALGVDIDDLRRVEAEQALTDAAARVNADRFEYFLHFAVDDASDRNALIAARKKALERAIGSG
ncbi:hypothetical protein NX905_21380 [Burkholderia thailandensis]|uniref:hypothetical protein n=1 Tax=Burkholderia thailandensis TaxID=57975 RepID=UPI00217EA657|nr:hypothetical protein [Burkholderia thailandensis]MCS6496800.1 hypothetical protein [Burkholderia thailandensis]